MNSPGMRTVNASGRKRVLVTKELPGQRWVDILTAADCRIEMMTSSDVLSVNDIKNALRTHCDGAIGQLTEDWGDEFVHCLKRSPVATLPCCLCNIGQKKLEYPAQP